MVLKCFYFIKYLVQTVKGTGERGMFVNYVWEATKIKAKGDTSHPVVIYDVSCFMSFIESSHIRALWCLVQTCKSCNTCVDKWQDTWFYREPCHEFHTAALKHAIGTWKDLLVVASIAAHYVLSNFLSNGEVSHIFWVTVTAARYIWKHVTVCLRFSTSCVCNNNLITF